MKTVDIKVNHGIAGRKAGEIVKVEVQSNGSPKDLFWRRRLRDAEIDGCVELVKDEPKKNPAKKTRDGGEE